MEYCKIDNVYAIRLDKGDEIIVSLTELCKKENIRLGTITGLGAVDYVSAGLYSVADKKYSGHEFIGEREIVSLTGNITRKDGDVYLHIHIAVSGVDSKVVGGHLIKAAISATSEIFVTKLNGSIARKCDEEIGLNILHFVE